MLGWIQKNASGEIIGFFPPEHQSIVTHHNRYMPIHFNNTARTENGTYC